MEEIKSGKTIGMRIKQRRKELGLSQEELAEALGVSYQQIQRYENGSNLLNVEKLQVIANCLEVPAGYFFDANARARPRPFAMRLSKEELKLVKLFREIGGQDKKTVMRIARLARAGKKSA